MLPRVPNLRSVFIEVYVFRRRGRRVEFLCLRRARVRFLPGVWQPVTGKRRARERSLAAAVREVREETHIAPIRWWALETPTVYYDHTWDEVLTLPLFAAEVTVGDEVRLSGEHDAWQWLPAREAGRLFLWEAQRRGLEHVRREVLAGGPLADALEVTASVRPMRSTRPGTARVHPPRPAARRTAPRADRVRPKARP